MSWRFFLSNESCCKRAIPPWSVSQNPLRVSAAAPSSPRPTLSVLDSPASVGMMRGLCVCVSACISLSPPLPASLPLTRLGLSPAVHSSLLSFPPGIWVLWVSLLLFITPHPPSLRASGCLWFFLSIPDSWLLTRSLYLRLSFSLLLTLFLRLSLGCFLSFLSFYLLFSFPILSLPLFLCTFLSASPPLIFPLAILSEDSSPSLLVYSSVCISQCLAYSLYLPLSVLVFVSDFLTVYFLFMSSLLPPSLYLVPRVSHGFAEFHFLSPLSTPPAPTLFLPAPWYHGSIHRRQVVNLKGILNTNSPVGVVWLLVPSWNHRHIFHSSSNFFLVESALYSAPRPCK